MHDDLSHFAEDLLRDELVLAGPRLLCLVLLVQLVLVAEEQAVPVGLDPLQVEGQTCHEEGSLEDEDGQDAHSTIQAKRSQRWQGLEKKCN